MKKKIIVTGGAGFIGSNLIKYFVKDLKENVLNLDKITYAGNINTLKEISKYKNYSFKKIDICNRSAIGSLIENYKPVDIAKIYYKNGATCLSVLTEEEFFFWKFISHL